MRPQGPTKGNAQLIRQNDFSFTTCVLLNKKNTYVWQFGPKHLFVSSQKETPYCKNSLALSPQEPKQYIFGNRFYLENTKKLRFHVFLLFHVLLYDIMWHYYMTLYFTSIIWHHHFTWSGQNSQEIVNFLPIVGPRGSELKWNKFTVSCEFDPLQVKWWCHITEVKYNVI